MSHATYLELSAKLREGHDRRKACVDAVMMFESTTANAKEREAVRIRIAAKAKPFKPLPDAIQGWKAQYTIEEERYSMLVLYGPSRTGKSRLARSLFGDQATLVVDVQHAEHPDLRAYRRGMHLAVLFDEVASPKFVVSNKKVLQAHVDGAILGQSATQVYTYEVFLHRTPLILTTNFWEYAEFNSADKNWIETNCVAVYIDTPVWETSPSGSGETTLPTTDGSPRSPAFKRGR